MATIVIQARLNSQRLPRKVLLRLPGGERIIDRIITTAQMSQVNNVVCVTPDIELADTITSCPVYVWGKERDVLGEFWFAAKNHRDDIIRLTADCPLLTPDIINLVYDQYCWEKTDYICNTHDDDPKADGYDVEIFSYRALEEAYKKAKTEYDREHVTPYIRRHFSTAFCPMPEMEGCSVDTYDDYLRVCKILENKDGGSSDWKWSGVGRRT